MKAILRTVICAGLLVLTACAARRSPAATPTALPTAVAATATLTATRSATPSVSATATATATPEPTLTPTATPQPTATPSETPVPTATATPEPTATPQPEPGTGRLPPAITGQIDALFARWNRPDSPGCAIGLGYGGELAYTAGYGMADLAQGTPITAGTIFNAGSISKQFTGMAIALLHEEGRLSLDDDIRRYVPELPDYGTPVTLRRLLSHTSGVRDDRTLALMAGRRDDELLSAADLYGLIFRQRGLSFTPGQEFLYSNSNYGLLALVVERVTGQTLPDFTRERILTPLGMASSHFAVDVTAVVPGQAYAYGRQGEGYGLSMPNVAIPGPSSLYTTVGDLVRWAGNFSSGQVGGPAALQQMEQIAALTNGTPVHYNFGLNLQTYAGLGRAIWHDGYDGGYRSQLLMLPDHGLTVAVMCNLETIDPVTLARQGCPHHPRPRARGHRRPCAHAHRARRAARDPLPGPVGRVRRRLHGCDLHALLPAVRRGRSAESRGQTGHRPGAPGSRSVPCVRGRQPDLWRGAVHGAGRGQVCGGD